MRDASHRLDANDVLYAVEASRDYDPGPGLEKINAPLIAINSADDLINPPELGILEREIRRVKNGKAVVIPFGPETIGHGTHTKAVRLEAVSDRAAEVIRALISSSLSMVRSYTTRGQRTVPSLLFLLACLFSGILAVASHAQKEPESGDKDALAFFESKVRPILAERCYSCHSAASAEPKGGLRLDSKEGVLKGGAHGAAVVPGDTAAGRLIRAIEYSDPGSDASDRQAPGYRDCRPEGVGSKRRAVAAGPQ